MEKGLVSIIIPCYNGEKYLDTCFNALLNQTYKKFEVIIINDGSTDGTSEKIEEYVEKFAKEKILLKKIEQENMGQAVATNKALKHVRGEFLVWQDCDDFYERDAIQNLKEFLDKNKDYQFVRGAVRKIDFDTKKILSVNGSKYPDIDKIFDLYVFETDSYCHAGIFMIRMDFFDECVKDREIYTNKGGQNWQLILPVAYKGRCGYIDSVVYNYYIIKASHSHIGTTTKELLIKYNKYKDILFHIIKDIDMKFTDKIYYYIKINIKYVKKKAWVIGSNLRKWCMKK